MPNSKFTFTRARLSDLAVPAPGMRITCWDTKVRGLQLRITSRGVKTFCVFRWIKGSAKPERITIGRFPQVSVDTARKQAEAINATIAQGNNPASSLRVLR